MGKDKEMQLKNPEREGKRAEKAEKAKEKAYERKKKRSERKKLIETTINLRTKDLAKEVEVLCSYNIKLALLTTFGAVLTALATINELWTGVINYFVGNSGETDVPVMSIILCLFGFFIIVLSGYSIIKQFRSYNPVRFVNHIIEEQYDREEYTAIFLIKAIFSNTPKILVFRSETWNSFFLPYCHYDPKMSDEEIKEKVKQPIAELLEVEVSDFEIYDDFFKDTKTYVTIKKNPTYNSMSKINYRFYYIKFTNGYLARRFLNNNMKHFSWKSMYELGKDIDTQLNNGDIVTIIGELALLNQSKMAFQEKPLSSYEISSKYNIIWNITDECFYDCPICATNSGKGCTCKASYDDKVNILLNLSSINGYIEKLDISGGDPLKNEDDRKIIKMAHQLLAFTDVKVTTTGEALEKLSMEEVVETVRKCDITYDIPYEVCTEELQRYREYNYNYHNFRQLERISNSGVNLELNIHIPILPAVKEEKMISMILEDVNRINPAEVKFIRLMPVGRMNVETVDDYSPEMFLNNVTKIIEDNDYKFNVSYNCSLATRLTNREHRGKPIRDCGMLRRKLGIDCNGRVFSCIWGAYIQEFSGADFEKNPFYLGDLKKESMYDILTKYTTLKLKRDMEDMQEGCRVCAYVKQRMDERREGSGGTAIEPLRARKLMLEAEDPLKVFYEGNLDYANK